MTSLNENSLQLRLEKRKGTMSEVDRAHFEKQQAECIIKAIKNEESPAKEKHVRRTIIGTWQERGNSMFWGVIGKQPLPSQAILCWKSLTVLHKITREGHPNVLKDSYVYRKTLRDLFSVYRFQAGTYGPLICEYLKILQSKLELHHKYPGIPGSLSFSQENPVKIPERDINDIFTFAVESLDYQDLLLSLEENVFKTLDKSKNNSQIAASQCRIATLVPLIKECSGMYDLLVYVLTKLHKNLPPETLDGHRERFNVQHKRLRVFCFEAGTLQYVTNLTAIPNIPEQPPDFLIHKYEPKKKREKPKEEPKPVQIAPQIDERDVLIEQLMREIEELREQLEYTEKQANEMETNLRMQIMKLQEDLKRMENLARQANEENKFLKEQQESMKEDSDAQEKAKSADEKFNKLKLLYGKLRQEHIDLLRKNAEIKQKEENTLKAKVELEENLNNAQEELLQKEKELANYQEKLEELEKINQDLKIDFDQTDQNSKTQIGNLNDEITALRKSLTDAEEKSRNLENELEETKRKTDEQVKSLGDQLQNITTGKITEESARKNAEDAISQLRKDKEQMRNELEQSLAETKTLLSSEEQARKETEDQLKKLQEDMNNEVSRLKQEIEKVTKEKEDQENAKNAAQSTLNALQSNSSSEIQKLTADLQELHTAKQSLLTEKEKLQQDLLSSQAELNKQLSELNDSLNETKQQLSEESTNRMRLENQLQQMTEEHASKVAMLSADLQQIKTDKEMEENLKKQKEEELTMTRNNNLTALQEKERQQQETALKEKIELLAATAKECEEIIQDTLEIFNNPSHESGTTCSAEYLKSRLDGLTTRVQNTTNTYSSFHTTHEDVLPLVTKLNSTCHHISDALIHGKATSHMAAQEDSQSLVTSCKGVGEATLAYLQQFKNHADPSNVQNDASVLEKEITKMIEISEELVQKQSDSAVDVENIVDEEMHATEKIVADAASRIEELLNKSRKTHSGVQLEVNERILDSCTGLMAAIQQLILRSKDLQDEIVAEGRGSASVTEFYKRHHKWTEGLLSAAKSVGYGATLLVDAADKVIERKAKMEELIVASHEISASTAQLVAASRVKASKYSKSLPPLMTASKGVGEATAGVVAAVRSGAAMAEESKTVPDYTKMSLTQAKRYEMDSQVKILELEDLLQKERSKLGQLRKAHYQIAVELYGEDQVNLD
ncbi:huntingtin-interacting protein 1-like isoform X1 [Hydractinia symbiolongicarpus]|uniref:huntingtin-interacting protein 1-like isoform X1 n=1 Tax=Hydractinia symbiolongicarpus TaxID=13093 RepID=UPI002550B6F0|nr:huntingtin-interacting protein 1-like isoform X1 [Hydractinia symbiolongicarpus]